MRKIILGLLISLTLTGLACQAQTEWVVKATNPLKIARTNQTLELSAKDLVSLTNRNFDGLRVRDDSGTSVLCQAVDSDGDGHSDLVIFQTSFLPGETKKFVLTAGSKKQTYAKEQFKVYGRLVHERFDDFAWENDRIAHRMYGKALETWKDEPLTSSAVDVWCKKVSRLVINDWYMTENYHSDHGEGADFYPAATSRGCGGSGLWANGKLWTSKNFVASRVLANGPIRVLFELTYDAFDVNGTKISEIKRVSLDAGQNFDHFQSFYAAQAPMKLTSGLGIRKADVISQTNSLEHGWAATWEPLKADKSNSHLGCAVILNPKQTESVSEDKLNVLLIGNIPQKNSISYWAGFAWDRGGQVADFAEWTACVDQFARELLSPLEISVQSIEK